MSGFRDIESRFADKNAQVLGVSTDDVDTQTRFAASLKLPFPLLADREGAVAKQYGVSLPVAMASRTTFVIGPDGKVVKVLEGKDALDPAPAAAACPLHRKKA